MSADKMVTEREAVERERKAFMAGFWWPRYADPRACLAVEHNLEPEAKRRYPLPKVRRLREVVFDGHAHRYDPTTRRFQYLMLGGGGWRCLEGPSLGWITDHIDALADLKANPWEEVDG